MKIISAILLAIFALSILSCQKEVVRETIVKQDSIIVRRDSIIIRRDTVIIIKQDVSKLFQRRWNLLSHEIEIYSNGQMVNKKEENFTANGFHTEFKANGTYTSFDLGGNNSGTWMLLSDNYYVLDKNTVNERYYYILSISEKNLINRGPFDKNNKLIVNYLFSAYFIT